MARLDGDQRNSWGSWWKILDSLLKTIDTSFYKRWTNPYWLIVSLRTQRVDSVHLHKI